MATTKVRSRSAKPKVRKICCPNCEKEQVETNYYSTSASVFFKKTPICKSCIEGAYKYYVVQYKEENHDIPEKDAIRRICMTMDIYYSESIFDSALKMVDNSTANMSIIGAYMRLAKLHPNNSKTYEDTIKEEKSAFFAEAVDENKPHKPSDETVRFFGAGLSDEDYAFLKEQYTDWTARHECNTKAQEEIFKRLSFKQLEILKATRTGSNTKDLDNSFQSLLESAKLQPKQNASESTSDSQTFGTLIDKWENERPIPEIDEDLRDVDKIGYLIHVFYTGHIAKVLELKSSLTAVYDKYIKKYTAEKKTYEEEEDDEVLFNSIFGNQNID